jgi:hypothetical protein
MEEKSPLCSPDLEAMNLLSISEDLVPTRESKISTTISISFDGLLDPPLLLKEDPKEGCGGYIWPAGMVLSKYMLQHHQDLGGKVM